MMTEKEQPVRREHGVPEAKGSTLQEEGRSNVSNQLGGQRVFSVIRSLGLSLSKDDLNSGFW